MKSFEDGELFIYINGDKAEIGKVKRKNNTGDGYFCYYHEGETAANTPLECMYKLVNSYTIEATTLGGSMEEEQMSKSRFRAWDKITKQYYIVKGLEYDDDGNLDEVYLAGVKISESNPVFNLRKPNDVVLEQYTDVKDDNDKEIAEGDIVQYIGADEETLIQATVKNGNPANEDRTLYIRGFYYGDCKIDESANLDDEEYEDLCIRVIGNIHENPELLEKEKE